MEFDPKEWGGKLQAGAEQRAQNLGYKYFEHTPRAYLGEAKKLFGAARSGGLEGLKGALPALGERALGLPMAMMGGGGGANPALKRIDLVPGMKATRGGTMPIVGTHEALEAAEATRTGFGDTTMENAYRQIPAKKAKGLGRLSGALREIPAEIAETIHPGAGRHARKNVPVAIRDALQSGMEHPQIPGIRMAVPGVHTSQHVSARLPISDIREGRLLGGKAQKTMEALRESTGEMSELTSASKKITGKAGYLPRKMVPQIAEQMTHQNLARGAEIAGAKAGPITSRLVKGLSSLRKLIGR